VLRFAPAPDVDLHEGAGLLRHFPRRRALASGDANDDRANFAAFARLQFDLFGDIVALVEQAEHRHAFVHRRCAVIIGRCSGGGCGHGVRLRNRHFDHFAVSRRLIARREQQGAAHREGQDQRPHRAPQLSALPGVQAS